MKNTKRLYIIHVAGEFEPFGVIAENVEYAIILLQAEAIKIYGKTYVITNVKSY